MIRQIRQDLVNSIRQDAVIRGSEYCPMAKPPKPKKQITCSTGIILTKVAGNLKESQMSRQLIVHSSVAFARSLSVFLIIAPEFACQLEEFLGLIC